MLVCLVVCWFNFVLDAGNIFRSCRLPGIHISMHSLSLSLSLVSSPSLHRGRFKWLSGVVPTVPPFRRTTLHFADRKCWSRLLSLTSGLSALESLSPSNSHPCYSAPLRHFFLSSFVSLAIFPYVSGLLPAGRFLPHFSFFFRFSSAPTSSRESLCRYRFHGQEAHYLFAVTIFFV